MLSCADSCTLLKHSVFDIIEDLRTFRDVKKILNWQGFPFRDLCNVHIRRQPFILSP